MPYLMKTGPISYVFLSYSLSLVLYEQKLTWQKPTFVSKCKTLEHVWTQKKLKPCLFTCKMSGLELDRAYSTVPGHIQGRQTANNIHVINVKPEITMHQETPHDTNVQRMSQSHLPEHDRNTQLCTTFSTATQLSQYQQMINWYSQKRCNHYIQWQVWSNVFYTVLSKNGHNVQKCCQSPSSNRSLQLVTSHVQAAPTTDTQQLVASPSHREMFHKHAKLLHKE